MSDWTIWLFAAASGFAAAGFLGALHQCLTGSRPVFRVSLRSPVHLVWGFFVCMFAGPQIVTAGALRRWRQKQLPVTVLLLAVMLSLVWSLCAGIVVAQFWLLTGMIAV